MTYRPVFAGAFGHTSRHNDMCLLYTPSSPGERIKIPGFPGEMLKVSGQHNSWKDVLDAPGAMQMKHLRALMESLPFQKGGPDQSLLASKIGAGSNHVRATRAFDRSYALVYLPAGGTVEVRLDKLSGPEIKGQWFDPRTDELCTHR